MIEYLKNLTAKPHKQLYRKLLICIFREDVQNDSRE